MIEIPAITLWRPWAMFIALRWKTVETRLHNRFAGLAGQRIAIHAGQTWDTRWFEAAGPYLTPQQIDQVHAFREIRSAVVAVATVAKVGPCAFRDSQAALIECYRTPRYGLWLADIEKLARPLFTKGHQGIWSFNLLEAT